jgi:hypothetical protein
MLNAEIMAIQAQMQGGMIPGAPGMEGQQGDQRFGTNTENITSDRSRGEIAIPEGPATIDMDKTLGAWSDTIGNLSPDGQKAMLEHIRNSSPDIHNALTQKMQEMAGTATDMRPLPDQRPQRRKKKS